MQSKSLPMYNTFVRFALAVVRKHFCAITFCWKTTNVCVLHNGRCVQMPVGSLQRNTSKNRIFVDKRLQIGHRDFLTRTVITCVTFRRGERNNFLRFNRQLSHTVSFFTARSVAYCTRFIAHSFVKVAPYTPWTFQTIHLEVNCY